MATPTSFFCPRAYTRAWRIRTWHSTIADFSLLTVFVSTLIEIGLFFALFLHFRESYRCFSVHLPRFSCSRFFFFASLENSHCHYCLCISPSVYKPNPCISPPNHLSEHVQAPGLAWGSFLSSDSGSDSDILQDNSSAILAICSPRLATATVLLHVGEVRRTSGWGSSV